jgi:hypothetical protein
MLLVAGSRSLCCLCYVSLPDGQRSATTCTAGILSLASYPYCHGIAVLDSYKGFCLAGLGAGQAKKLCPSDIEVACYYGPNYCMLSGPAESVKKFVKTLQHQGIFTTEVNTANIAYHSKYISSAGPLLLKYLKQVTYVHFSQNLKSCRSDTIHVTFVKS